MSEQQWLTSIDCEPLFGFFEPLRFQRKSSLLFAATCDVIRPLLPHEVQQMAIERFFQVLECTEKHGWTESECPGIEGACYSAESLLTSADRECLNRIEQMPSECRQDFIRWSNVEQPDDPFSMMSRASYFLHYSVNFPLPFFYGELVSNRYCCFINPHFLRDIFGNPFRPVTFAPAWQTASATTFAQSMYDRRDFAAMPVLADLLEEAGCDSAEVLSHCRDEKQVHVRGCWVVDLVLGKA